MTLPELPGVEAGAHGPDQEPQGQLWESEWVRSQKGVRLALRQSLWGLGSLSLQSQAGQ